MKYIKLAWRFVVKSSADPKRSSLMVKSLLLGAVTIFSGELLQGLNLVCEFGYKCYYFDPSILEELRILIDQVAQGVYAFLLLISIAGAIYGGLRKLLLTVKGENAVLQEDV